MTCQPRGQDHPSDTRSTLIITIAAYSFPCISRGGGLARKRLGKRPCNGCSVGELVKLQSPTLVSQPLLSLSSEHEHQGSLGPTFSMRRSASRV